MPPQGFKVTSIRDNQYALARRQAEEEEISLAELVGKAIETYVHRHKDWEEKIRKFLIVLDNLERDRLQISNTDIPQTRVAPPYLSEIGTTVQPDTRPETFRVG